MGKVKSIKVRTMKSLITVVFFVCSTAALAQDVNPPEESFVPPKKEYSPFVGDHFPTKAFFGDTHVHTSYSTDAGMVGTTLGQDEAYRFARGEAVTSSLGWNVKLHRPLDFLVIADHAENLGLADFIRRSDPILLANEQGKIWHDQVKAGEGYEAFVDWLNRGMAAGTDLINDDRMAPAVWDRVIENADRYNQPGTFTAFIGFEWSSAAGDSNLHRNVVFRDGEEHTRQTLPFSLFDSDDPEGLWAYMSGYEESTGGRVLAIPHNGNLSNGVMFQTTTLGGRPLDQAYADMRMRFEPIYEVTQIKGDGEAHPFLSPDDEFADFETLDKGNIVGTEAKRPEMFAGEYAREALKVGLRLEDDLGTNPYKFGMIGSTDAHTGLATTREDNNFGKVSFAEPSAERAAHVLIRSKVDPALDMMVYETGASGLAAVWARENTRESLWDAMERKEVYATTGSRISVRIFGGWDFTADEVERHDFAREGYARGVPMGGDLTNGPDGKAPSFMIRAMRDPDNANLDRVQVIKGWLDDGELYERIYDVACSDGRAIVERRCVREVGSTVDVADASYTNTIGDPLMTAHWIDPDFDPDQRAFYYVRVIEIPKPRWTAYDAKFFNVTMPDDVAMTVQDRAYTSPIWYTP
jgi:hypothetical protein